MDNEVDAEALHQQAMRLHDQGEEEQALALYHRALACDEARSNTHYNIGLIHKYRGEWEASYRHNQRATELAPDDVAAHWNLAIAATALKQWKTVRDVWSRQGVDVGAGDGPIEVDFGITPVRLNPDEGAEVVWARRIDPVRARILSIPLASSGFCHGDIVLHDGAAVGYRELNGHERPVFNVLELYQPSPDSTYEVEVRISSADDVAAMLELLRERNIACEDWSTSVQALCRQCSEGRPHDQHQHEPVRLDENSPLRVIAVAGPDEAAIRQAFAAWAGEGRAVVRMEQVLGAQEFE